MSMCVYIQAFVWVEEVRASNNAQHTVPWLNTPRHDWAHCGRTEHTAAGLSTPRHDWAHRGMTEHTVAWLRTALHCQPQHSREHLALNVLLFARVHDEAHEILAAAFRLDTDFDVVIKARRTSTGGAGAVLPRHWRWTVYTQINIYMYTCTVLVAFKQQLRNL